MNSHSLIKRVISKVYAELKEMKSFMNEEEACIYFEELLMAEVVIFHFTDKDEDKVRYDRLL